MRHSSKPSFSFTSLLYLSAMSVYFLLPLSLILLANSVGKRLEFATDSNSRKNCSMQMLGRCFAIVFSDLQGSSKLEKTLSCRHFDIIQKCVDENPWTSSCATDKIGTAALGAYRRYLGKRRLVLLVRSRFICVASFASKKDSVEAV